VVRGALDEPLGERAQLAGRVVSDAERVIGVGVELERGDIGTGVELPDLGMDDVVERQQERPGVGVSLEERGIGLGEERDRALSEPAQDIVRRDVEGLGRDADELQCVLVRIGAECGVCPVEVGLVQQRVPRVVAVLARHGLLQKVEDDPLHAPLPVNGGSVPEE
jgi:hypothetical protein